MPPGARQRRGLSAVSPEGSVAAAAAAAPPSKRSRSSGGGSGSGAGCAAGGTSSGSGGVSVQTDDPLQDADKILQASLMRYQETMYDNKPPTGGYWTLDPRHSWGLETRQGSLLLHLVLYNDNRQEKSIWWTFKTLDYSMRCQFFCMVFWIGATKERIVRPRRALEMRQAYLLFHLVYRMLIGKKSRSGGRPRRSNTRSPLNFVARRSGLGRERATSFVPDELWKRAKGLCCSI